MTFTEVIRTHGAKLVQHMKLQPVLQYFHDNNLLKNDVYIEAINNKRASPEDNNKEFLSILK